MSDAFAVVVPWYDPDQASRFLDAWGIGAAVPDWLLMVHDSDRSGCAETKNRGVAEVVARGVDMVVLLDDDCFPTCSGPQTLEHLAEAHFAALEPQPVELYRTVTTPPSRGTPYARRTVTMPVAASMGFWEGVGDYCAVRQLVYGEASPMEFDREAVHGQYFPLSGMNLAFRPAEWLPWCSLIDVPRYDDIWMGWLWQREAYRRGCCFNLAGPLVRHSRQSNVWKNLVAEARHAEVSEDLWAEIATRPYSCYADLRALLPSDPGGSDR